MKAGRLLTLAAVLMLTSACYHQVINTGRTPGPTVVHKPWTSTWFFGIVPAAPIDVTSQCPNGVATVETRRSFMNGLVGIFTGIVWAPIDVKVTCAVGRSSLNGLEVIRVGQGASKAELDQAISSAITLSLDTGKPVGLTY